MGRVFLFFGVPSNMLLGNTNFIIQSNQNHYQIKTKHRSVVMRNKKNPPKHIQKMKMSNIRNLFHHRDYHASHHFLVQK